MTAKVVAFEVTTSTARRAPVRSVNEEKEAFTARVRALETEIFSLSNAVSSVRGDTVYFKQREEAHRNTNESTNSRIMWWSIFELVIVFLLSIVQVYFIRGFFEKR